MVMPSFSAKRMGMLWMLLPFLLASTAQSQSLPDPVPVPTAQTGNRVSTASQPGATKAAPSKADDRETRIQIANHLKQMGEQVNWQRYDLMTLLDMESRVESARQLRSLGVTVDWRKYDSNTLTDMEMRVETAHDLERLGVRVDWRKYDHTTLLDMQTVAETAQRLRQKGIVLEWRNGAIAVVQPKEASRRAQMQTNRTISRLPDRAG